jgi:sterol desaturase/sphingolipid hydroxylase (fatty acid hydroxylase superfamily)
MALVLGYSVLSFLISDQAKYMALAGYFLGSLAYDGIHLSYHFGPDLPIPFYQAMKSAHMRHHFRDNSIEFGVTVDFWDRICCTKRKQLKA